LFCVVQISEQQQKSKFLSLKECYSVTYQKTSTHSGKINGGFEIMKFRLILKPELKEVCNFCISASNQHIYEFVVMNFSLFFL